MLVGVNIIQIFKYLRGDKSLEKSIENETITNKKCLAVLVLLHCQLHYKLKN